MPCYRHWLCLYQRIFSNRLTDLSAVPRARVDSSGKYWKANFPIPACQKGSPFCLTTGWLGGENEKTVVRCKNNVLAVSLSYLALPCCPLNCTGKQRTVVYIMVLGMPLLQCKGLGNTARGKQQR